MPEFPTDNSNHKFYQAARLKNQILRIEGLQGNKKISI